jgi:hypothetical protein
MTRRSYSRDDVQTHSDHFGPARPAVNVKVYRTFRDAWPEYERAERDDERFTLEWIEENLSDDELDAYFWSACESEFEYLEGWATGSDGAEDSLFPDDRVRLWTEGRSGGWIVVDGLPDIEEWDAVRLARWRKFERIARSVADGIPLQMLGSIEINAFGWAMDEQEERARAEREGIATEVRT